MVERGLVPDGIIRLAIRKLCRNRLQEQQHSNPSELLESMRVGPIALMPEAANEQHYELPPAFFAAFLGPRRKYSCCLWPSESTSLAAAENAALVETCTRAEIADGQQILELGCGWGSLSLWMAEQFPHSQIVAVSNSSPQREFIEAAAAARQLCNLNVVKADMNSFDPARIVNGSGDGKFDRVVSVEMFEHMRNYEQLLSRIAAWLRTDGKLFVHIFCHRKLVYPFETKGAANWMGRYFFSGGIMPSADLLSHFAQNLQVAQQWNWNGRHYQRTAEAWLANFDNHCEVIYPMLEAVYSRRHACLWRQRWRIFFLAVAELFAYRQGDEWFVSHYLLEHTQ